MKILITGSGGMLGHELCGVLSKAGHNVIGVDINPPDTRYPIPNTFSIADINDKRVLNSVFEKENPGIVVHTAAWTDVDGCEKSPQRALEINSRGTINVAEAAKKFSARLVYISTDFVFDGMKKSPYTELDACAPLGVYAKTKWEGEKAAARILENYAVVRTSWLFGRGGKNFVNTIISKVSEEKALKVVDDQIGSPTYAKDLAYAINKLIEKGIKGKETYHVCNSGQCSWFDFALKIKSLVPAMKDAVIEAVSSAELGRPAPRPAFSVMDTSKFRNYTGMELRNWEEALREYLLERCHPEEAAGDRRI